MKMCCKWLCVMLMFVTAPAFAADVTLTWQWPIQYCDGDELPLTDVTAAEIYVSENPIPRVAGACGTEQDVPPSGAIIQQVTTPDTSVTIDLTCGRTYYFVMRLQVTSGEWSNFSGEAMRNLECARPDIPIIISLS